MFNLFHAGLRVRGWRYRRALDRRIDRFQADQLALASEFAVHAVTPQPYSEKLRAEILSRGECSGEDYELFETSGSTSKPKVLFYPRSRTMALRGECLNQMALLYRYAGLRRPVIYFLTSLKSDRSLSNGLIRTFHRETSELSFFPSVVRKIVSADGEHAENQLWLHTAMMLLTQPSLLATANPSSLLVLVQSAREYWKLGRRRLPQILEELARTPRMRVHLRAAPGRAAEIARLLEQDTISPGELLPKLDVLVCWTGGYVEPYIAGLVKMFGKQLRVLPMLSLSTETVCGVVDPGASLEGCLPLYPGVLYEFLPEDGPRDVLVAPWKLESGRRASMVVSDRFGLRRYDTEDLFECRGHHRGVPLITFCGRRGLQHSFTGEKLTDMHLLDAYEELRKRLGIADLQLGCFPNRCGSTGEIPSYSFLLLAGSFAEGAHETATLAAHLDAILCEINLEYKSKRSSARLGAPSLELWSVDRFVRQMKRNLPNANIAQIKILPLYPKIDWHTFRDES